jgi:hypothetical protein
LLSAFVSPYWHIPNNRGILNTAANIAWLGFLCRPEDLIPIHRETREKNTNPRKKREREEVQQAIKRAREETKQRQREERQQAAALKRVNKAKNSKKK